MGLFRKKKMDYGYYSSYSSKRRRLRVDRAALAVIAGILLVVGIVVYFNFNRIQFLKVILGQLQVNLYVHSIMMKKKNCYLMIK